MAEGSQPSGAARGPLQGAYADIFLLAARCCLAFEFVMYGVKKLLNPSGTAAFIASHGLPGELVYLVIPLQIGCGWLTIFGLFTRPAALALAFFCTVAPSIFWAYDLDNFTRDLGSAGGFLFLYAAGPGRLSLDGAFKITGERIFGSASGGAREMAILLALARAFLSVEFIADGLAKAANIVGARAFFAANGLASDLVYPAIAFELAVGLLVLAGLRTRFAAVSGALAALVFAALHSPFADSEAFARALREVTTMVSFSKDVGTLGAFLVLFVYGAGQLSLDAARNRPGLQTATA